LKIQSEEDSGDPVGNIDITLEQKNLSIRNHLQYYTSLNEGVMISCPAAQQKTSGIFEKPRGNRPKLHVRQNGREYGLKSNARVSKNRFYKTTF
jgi:hypothetical protein